MFRYITKESQGPSGDQTLDSDVANEPNDGETEIETTVDDVLSESTHEQVENHGDGDNVDDSSVHIDLDSSDTAFQPEIFDPRCWDSLDAKQLDILAQLGPKRDLSIQKGPKDRLFRRSALLYTRILSNREKYDRDWLVYSKELDRVFCFCCKLFTKGREHRYQRLQKDQTIDKAAQRQLEKEKDHWRKKWHILKDNMTGLILKSVSTTRWESRVESVKAIRFQCAKIREALLQVSESDNEPLTSSEAKGLANNELGEYEFLVAIVIWYEVLYAVNLVSKSLQGKDMLIDVAVEKVQGLISFFKGYRETGFLNALKMSKEIALEMNIGTTFHKKREIKRKRHFDENRGEESVASQTAEDSFRINYFIHVIDQAISSLTRRFEQYQGYQKIFGFLFTSDTLLSKDSNDLKSSCDRLEAALKKDGKFDIDATELHVELIFLQSFISQEKLGPVEILKFLKRHDCFPNATIAYRILLTIPVTIASAEWSFSKLKLLKSYLRSTMSQERLNGLAIIALEGGMLGRINIKLSLKILFQETLKECRFSSEYYAQFLSFFMTSHMAPKFDGTALTEGVAKSGMTFSGLDGRDAASKWSDQGGKGERVPASLEVDDTSLPRWRGGDKAAVTLVSSSLRLTTTGSSTACFYIPLPAH
ncbi:hypothetical protein OsJ_31531 [Oryza sativa Japonica Group]|uniref:HAT C-terminal dimerisation domain-containing protein n=1 Tax=Oryza sativa subsp. japonica TaxID=39947 RepID=B9G5R7_ORYSJ|nr:hypothetical protein OsJ_31531 [Oryza sativa Japonica Group]